VHRRVLVAVACTAALVLAPAAIAGAAACGASDVGCKLGTALTGVNRSLHPTTTTTVPKSTTTSAASAAAARGGVRTAAVAPAAPAVVTPTTAPSLAGTVPPVPVGGQLDLPPLQVPDFGAPPVPTNVVVARVPVRRATPATSHPARPPAPAHSTAGAVAGLVSVAIAFVVAAGALLARRLRVPRLQRPAFLARLPRPRLRSRIRVVSG
jgi:hypothetical protein